MIWYSMVLFNCQHTRKASLNSINWGTLNVQKYIYVLNYTINNFFVHFFVRFEFSIRILWVKSKFIRKPQGSVSDCVCLQVPPAQSLCLNILWSLWWCIADAKCKLWSSSSSSILLRCTVHISATIIFNHPFTSIPHGNYNEWGSDRETGTQRQR